MYCNLSKTQALPMAFRVSSQQQMGLNPLHTSKKFQSFSHYPKPSLNPKTNGFGEPTSGLSHRIHRTVQVNKPRKISFSFGGLCVEFALPKSQLRGVRSYSSLYNGGQRNGEVRARKNLPWLGDDSPGEESRAARKKVGKSKATGGGSGSGGASKSPWEISAEKFLQGSGGSAVEGERRRSRVVDVAEDWRKPRVRRDERNEEDGEGGEDEVVKDVRWNKIKVRAGRVMDSRGGSDRPEMRRWNREENWGRKTFKEASESSVPKMTGEGLYGVGPVLAALSAGRREFYTLYVQEGLELSKSNRKRKDKKGFEKVLKIAEKIGLSIREVSKHDLNMVADNRPHQGLVLDTSPLEMINIRELETVSAEHDKGVLWVAIDEVTDPQNLGAIIRSSYFFGAAGVVLCAKNSAPLSGVVSKASAGSLELMEMRSCKNMMQFLTSSAENGWRVVGGSISSRAVPVQEVAPGEPTILVLGSEGTGLRPLVERSCTQLVRIPGNIPVDITSGRFEDNEDSPVEEDLSSKGEFQSFMAVESLNVSVAAGVLLHHFIGSNYTSSDVSVWASENFEAGDYSSPDIERIMLEDRKYKGVGDLVIN